MKIWSAEVQNKFQVSHANIYSEQILFLCVKKIYLNTILIQNK